MRNPLVAPELRELLEEGRQDELRELIESLHPNDAASILSGLETLEIVETLSLLPVRLERDVFEYFEPELQEEIVLGSGRARVRELLKALPSDERYEFFERLDPRVRAQLVPLLEQAARADILDRERFEDDQIGSFLSTEYCKLGPAMTAEKALAELRLQEPNRETIYYSYVVDDDGRLIGFVSLRKLITAQPTATVESLMKTEPVSVPITADQEEAARLIREYDLLALPVVDADGVLSGIVTYDDAADIQEAEDTEDIERMAGISGEAEQEGGYMAESVMSQIRRRIPLISFLAVFNLSTAFVIQNFEHLLTVAMLIALLPIVMATGGMVGTQASSLVIRGLTLGELDSSSIRSVLWKEVRICGVIALVLSAIIFCEGLALSAVDANVGLERAAELSLAVAIAMAVHVVGAGVFGASVPILANRFGLDPAMVSTPAVTAIADLAGATLFVLVVLVLVS